MNGLTALVLRHRRWVMLAWLIVALVGAATLGSTTKRLSTQFKMPGEPSFVADSKIQALYHTMGVADGRRRHGPRRPGRLAG